MGEWWKKESRSRQWMRKRLINASGGRCCLCGDQCNLVHNHPKQATIDHIIPLALGGRHILSNVQLLCSSCNSHKGSTPPEWWDRYAPLVDTE